jgi:hypothetical protein
VKNGYFLRQSSPQRIQRFRCDTCRRNFSTQTFETDYWLRLGWLLPLAFHHNVACAAHRQVARMYGVSPQTIARHTARLARQCQLAHELLRPKGQVREPLAVDSFESFEYSQYHPTSFHVAVGQRSHYFYGFTDSELRRKGRMTSAQKRRRAQLEAQFGRPSPTAIERDFEALLRIVGSGSTKLEIHTDEHQAYPRAIRRLKHLAVNHQTISSRAARTPQNPLFPVNLLDLLFRHSQANDKRETIAFAKRRACADERKWAFLFWRNYGKSFSERHPGVSPAMRLGLTERLWTVEDLLAERLFLSRIGLPGAWEVHYRRLTPTRRIAHPTSHRLKYAF